jgi:hypothetical protein
MIGTGGQLDASGTEDTQVADFINRRFQQAFDASPVWPRYFVNSEARDLISLTVSGLGAGSSSDNSGIVNGNYILLGQDSGGNDGVAGTNVYYNPAQGTRSDIRIAGSTVIYKRNGNGKWQINTNSGIDISSSGVISADGGGGVSATEADANAKDNPSDVVNWTIDGTTLSGAPLLQNTQLIPYAQSDRTTIGDFNRIYRKKAFLNNSAIEYEFFVDLNGANILNITSTTDNEAFVSYKKQFTPFTVTSDFYNQGAVEVPGEFFNFIAHAVYADFLRVQNRQQEAIAEEQVAQTYLNLELEKIDIRSNNNTVNKRFSTYVNRQSR